MENMQIKQSYDKAILNRWQNFAVRVNAGWVFGKVVNFEDTHFVFDRYNTVSPKTGLTTIGTNDTPSEFHIWKDQNNFEYFWEGRKDKVLQAFVGIKPVRTRLFKAMPDDVKRGRLEKIIVGGLNDNTIGWIDGNDSPFSIPGTQSELIVLPEMNVEFGVYNPENYAINPRFNVIIRRLDVRWYDVDNTVQKKSIEDMITSKIPCHYWSPGIDNFEYDLNQIGISAVDVEPTLGFKGYNSTPLPPGHVPVNIGGA